MQYFPILELLQDSCDPPLTPQDIEELELALGVRLPQEYVEFLLEHNGGHFVREVVFDIPNPTTFINSAILVDFFGEPDDRIGTYGMIEAVDRLSDRVPAGFLPIAHCNSSDLLLLKLDDPQSEFQGVWFWDSAAIFISEEEQSLYWLADTFNDFLGKLVYDFCDDPAERETQPLFQAIERGDIKAVERHIAASGSIDESNERGETLLMAAVIYRWPKIARMLLAHGANPNSRDAAGMTPLHHAAQHSIDGVKLLLAAGADATARDNQGRGVLADWSYRANQILKRHGAVEDPPTAK